MTLLPLLQPPNLNQVIAPCPAAASPETPLMVMLTQLDKHMASCVVLLEEGHPVGIVTMRDIVRLTGTGLFSPTRLLGEVASRPVISLTSDKAINLLDVMRVMRRHQIHHLPLLTSKGELSGVISHEQIYTAIAALPQLSRYTVAEVMQFGLVTVAPTMPLIELAQLMTEQHISTVAISQPGGSMPSLPVGIVTERDIVHALAQDCDPASTLAAAVMYAPVITCRADESLWDACRRMEQQHLCGLIVVGAHGEALGLLTRSAVINAFEPVELRRLAAHPTQSISLKHRTTEDNLTTLPQREQPASELCNSLEQLLAFTTLQAHAASKSLAAGHTPLASAALAAQTAALEEARTMVRRLIQDVQIITKSSVAATITPDVAQQLLPSAPVLRLLLVDATPHPHEPVGQLLDAGAFQVIGSAADGVAALVQARKLRPDVVLLDVHLPGMDGLATLSLLRMELPELRVVMLTDVEDEETVCEALRRGASGYLLKTMNTAELVWQLHSLTTGGLALAPNIAQRLLRRITNFEQHDNPKHNEDPDPRTLLTPRQLKVLTMLSHGYAYKEVGQMLGFSVPTIKREVAAAVKQLQVRHRREALALVRRHLVFPFYQRKNLAS